MTWDREKIRGLRLRMGWSQSDLARRLQTNSDWVRQWESGDEAPASNILSKLDLLLRQADASADDVSNAPIAEAFLEEEDLEQCAEIKLRRELDSN